MFILLGSDDSAGLLLKLATDLTLSRCCCCDGIRLYTDGLGLLKIFCFGFVAQFYIDCSLILLAHSEISLVMSRVARLGSD